MGNVSMSCCRSKSPRLNHHEGNHSSASYRNVTDAQYSIINQSYGRKISNGKDQDHGDLQHQSNILQHISEREPDDSETDPSSNPFNKPIFASRSSYTSSSVNGSGGGGGIGGGKMRGNSVSNNESSYSSNSYSQSRRLTNTPLTSSSQDHGYNSGASTNMTDNSQMMNDSFEFNNTTHNNKVNHVKQNQASRDQVKQDDYNSNDDTIDLATYTKKRTISTLNQSHNLVCINSLPNYEDEFQRLMKKSSSCSTIFIDDSTISQPDLTQTIKSVSLAIYYHIRSRTSDESVEIFDETIHPLKMPAPNTPDTQDNKDDDCFQDQVDEQIDQLQHQLSQLDTSSGQNRPVAQPTRRYIHNFVKTLFKAAQLTSEYAITTLVYLERLMTYAEMDLTPKTWRRMFLGAILLSSKVWEDQAVWNVDYAQILEEISVEDINELERQFLELIQFNMNVPSSVYAKYYFHLRTLSLRHGLNGKHAILTVGKSKKLEAMSRSPTDSWESSPIHRKTSPYLKRHTSLENLRLNGQARAVLM